MNRIPKWISTLTAVIGISAFALRSTAGESGGIAPRLTIVCDRLVEGQVIGFGAELN